MLRNIVVGIKVFFRSMGLVEQAQVVASTAVIVVMVTIVSSKIAAGVNLGPLDFISVVTVGVIGYVSVYFSLKYGRMLEEQRRELLELNTVAEAVNHSVELNFVLHTALHKVMELMQAEAGWIYINEDDTLVLRLHGGTSVPFFPPSSSINDETLRWIRTPSMIPVDHATVLYSTTAEIKEEGIRMIASIPLYRQNIFAGVLIIGSKEEKKFQSKKIAVIQAFGNQIGAALSNAYLFEQVRQSEQEYADLYENSPDMYQSVNRKGVIVSCNLTECQTLGLSKDEIVGKPLLTLFPPSQHQSVREQLEKIFDEGTEVKGIEGQLQRPNGSLIDVSINTSLIRDTEGKPIIIRMVLRDITERKKMEEKILQAQKIDSLGNITGGIAHDFNNILTAILGSASIMRRKVKEDPRLLKYIDLIEQTSRRGAAITRQLTTFARKHNPHIDRIDVNTAVEQTVRLFEVTASKSIHIKCVYAPEPLIVEADEAQLQQALLNLCLNARDAMPNGGILVIQCQSVGIDEQQTQELTEIKPGPYATVSITDSGTGIPPQVLPRIFEPFFTTKDQGKGTGLGLSVVYGVVRSHNGCITVKSEVDSGTVFTMYLPQVPDAGVAKPGPCDDQELPGGNERILLVEDEISIGVIGSDILGELGYQITVASNGREAVDLLERSEERFHLVILDMNMPRMGGRATFERIKELRPSLKVLVCSGYSATILDDGKFTQSIDGFLQKPYELIDIARKVRSVLDAPPVTSFANQGAS